MSIGNDEFNFLVEMQIERRRNEGLPVNNATNKRIWVATLDTLLKIGKINSEQHKSWKYPSEWDNEVEGSRIYE